VGVLVVLGFWVPPSVVSILLVRWAVRQPRGQRHGGGTVLASALAFVAWWFILLGVGGLIAVTVSKLLDGAFVNATVGAALLALWAAGMTILVKRGRGRWSRPFELVNAASIWAGGMAIPLAGLVLVTSVI